MLTLPVQATPERSPVSAESFSPEDSWYLTVTDIKQWDYCQRIVFYAYCMPRLRPISFKMEAGLDAHDEERARERRRTGQIYGLDDAERIENVHLESPKLGLRGRIDLVLRRGDQAWPVDYKLSRQLTIADHFKLQLAAYALMLEEAWGVACPSGYLYSLVLRQADMITIDSRLRKRVLSTLERIRGMIAAERIPPSTSEPSHCVNCEFRRFCNDIF